MRSWDEPARTAQMDYYRLLASSPAAETHTVGNGFAVTTGIFSNTENGVVAAAASQAEIEGTIAWLQELQAPAMWLGADEELHDALLCAGCRPDAGGVDMGGDLTRLGLPQPSPPPGIEIRRVRFADELDQALAFLYEGGDHERACRVFGSLGFADEAPLRHYLASEDGRPVGMAVAFFTDPIVLLQHVVVAESHRGGGLGRALALVRLHDARERRCGAAVLGPTPESRRLYEPLGFTITPAPGRDVLYLPLAPPAG